QRIGLHADPETKVRKLIDDHIISLGIDPKIPPMAITDADFDQHLDKHRSPKAKASEMEHALRYHISKHLNEDPELFEALSKRLDRILTQLKDRWEELVAALREFSDEVRAGRQEDGTGLDPETQAPFLGVLRQEVGKGGEVNGEDMRKLVEATVGLVDHIKQEIGLIGFWSRAQAQDALRSWIVQYLDELEILPYDRLPAMADRLLELAKVNHHKLVK
ncbi:MAG TPA: restriction endonuclease subunit R, partial [Myxococcota bacterium]|nr:restriction endonuclease subunit R [Myxococcota bacterium]